MPKPKAGSTSVVPRSVQPLELTPPGKKIELSQVGAVSALGREESEMRGAIASAHQWPRDEEMARERIMQSMSRPAFADEAIYSYPRGGRSIEGVGVKGAREFARLWGNIAAGFAVVSEDEESVQLRGGAVDYETNARFYYESRFKKLVWRKGEDGKGGSWLKPDERDLRELVNKHGAILERNGILRLIPADLTDEALERGRQALKGGAKQELAKQGAEAVAQRVLLTFQPFGVSKEMLEKYLGYPLDKITDEHVAHLREILAALKEGHATVQEVFAPAAQQTSAVGTLKPVADKERSAGSIFGK